MGKILPPFVEAPLVYRHQITCRDNSATSRRRTGHSPSDPGLLHSDRCFPRCVPPCCDRRVPHAAWGAGSSSNPTIAGPAVRFIEGRQLRVPPDTTECSILTLLPKAPSRRPGAESRGVRGIATPDQSGREPTDDSRLQTD